MPCLSFPRFLHFPLPLSLPLAFVEGLFVATVLLVFLSSLGGWLAASGLVPLWAKGSWGTAASIAAMRASS